MKHLEEGEEEEEKREAEKGESGKIIEEITVEMFPIIIKTTGQQCHNTQET